MDSELSAVQLNGAASESYGYDSNGNRTSANGINATFDAQDRITQAGGTTFEFDASGMLQSRGDDDFIYGSRGELLAADLGDGTAVTYSYDVMGRQTMRHGTEGTTHFLFASPSDAFQVSASKAPNGVYTQYLYDDAECLSRLIAVERSSTWQRTKLVRLESLPTALATWSNTSTTTALDG